MVVGVGLERTNSHLLMMWFDEEPNSLLALNLSKGIKEKRKEEREKEDSPEVLLNDSEHKKEENPERVWSLITKSHGNVAGIQKSELGLEGERGGGERETAGQL